MDNLKNIQDSFTKAGIEFSSVERTNSRDFHDIVQNFPTYAVTLNIKKTGILFAFDSKGSYLGLLSDKEGDGYFYDIVAAKKAN